MLSSQLTDDSITDVISGGKLSKGFTLSLNYFLQLHVNAQLISKNGMDG